jgi:hypothetical protein
MGVFDGPTQRLDGGHARGVRRSQNGPQAGVYVSHAAKAVDASDQGPGSPGAVPAQRLRELARSGRLAEAAATAGSAERTVLTGAAYDVVWPIVFTRVTYRMELNRGHTACATGVARLADDCLDRFHDDVEAVVEDLLAHARQPIQHLEGWIARRLNAATVDGYRRRRGQRGALQRPRLPGWLATELGHDRWLTKLATHLLVWVGVSGTAGTEVWPLEAWAHARAECTGDWPGSDPAVVSREVETVLAVMRRRPQWYESYVERPLGRKQTAVSALQVHDESGSAAPLDLAEPDARIEAEMSKLAADAVNAIRERLAKGQQTRVIVADVIRTVFGGPFAPTMDRAPHDVADPLGGVTGALLNPARLDRIVATVRDIIGERDG